MSATPSGLKPRRWRWGVLAAATAASVCLPTPAAASSRMITVGEPEGFSDLMRDRDLMVDVYFGGTRRGEAMVRVGPDSITILDPAAVVQLLPPVTDAGAVLARMRGRSFAPNSDLACAPASDRAHCGRLSPDDIGVIFARDRFRLDIFLNPRFIAVETRPEDRYLSIPSRSVSMVNTIGGIVSGQIDAGEHYIALHNQLVLARGEQRLRADVSLDNSKFTANRVALEWDRPERRFTAGAFWTPGNSLAGGTKIAGVGVESQIDTRRDREELLGSPVIVYLDGRARIDALYEGRVVSSKVYEAGNQQLDTAGLPEGSYELTLRIQEPGRPVREERRFYSKSRRVPSLGRSDFYLFGGFALEGAAASVPASEGLVVQGGYARRLSPHLALDGVVSLDQFCQSAELGATFLSSIAQGRAAFVASSDGRVGSVLRVNSAGPGLVNFSFDLRAMSSSEPVPGMPGKPDLASNLPRAGFTQVGGLVSHSRGDIRVLGTFYLRDQGGADLDYAFGPSIEWDALRFGPAVVTVRGEVAVTQAGTSGFAGLALRFTGRRGAVSAISGYRKSTVAGDRRGSGPSGAVAAAWTSDVVGGKVALGTGYEFSADENSALGSFEFAHPAVSLTGDIQRTARRGDLASNYTLGLQTTLIAGPGAPIRPIGKSSTDSVIVAQVAGARHGDRFDVLVDDQVSGSLSGSQPATLRLPAYRAYNVRIRPVGADLVAYDSSAREVSLFPGSVTELTWDAAPVVIKFGRLVDANGEPVASATITGRGVWTQTDEKGWFQLEAPEGLAIEVTTSTGARFAMVLPEVGDLTTPVMRLGAVVCCETPALDNSKRLTQLTGPAERKGN